MPDRVTTLAGALVGVCFAPACPDPAGGKSHDTLLVADALGDAVDVLDARFDDLGDELVRAYVGLLTEVRTMAADRLRCGAAAEALFRHVAEVATPEPDAYVGLLEVLAALATLPDDGGDEIDLALDPTPDPASAVEVALAATSPVALDAAVHDATFHAPVLDLTVDHETGHIAVQFLPVVIDGTPCISVFTSRERVEWHVRRAGVPVEAVPVVELEGHELPGLCPPGHGVAINPGMVLGHACRPG